MIKFTDKLHIITLILLCLSIIACGKQEVQDTSAIGIDGYVYVPKYRDLLTDDDLLMLTYEVAGDTLYYVEVNKNDIQSPRLYRLSLTEDSDPQEISLSVIGGSNITRLRIDPDGNFRLLSQEFNEDYTYITCVITTYDSDGQFISSLDVSSQINDDTGYPYVNFMEIDGEGNLYISNGSSVFLYDPSGQYHGKFESEYFINMMETGKDGKVYTYTIENNSPKLITIDYAAKRQDKVYKKIPSLDGLDFAAGTQNNFLLNSGNVLYAYDPDTQSSRKILNWIDSDVTFSTILQYWALEDGRIVVLNELMDENSRNIELVTLTKTPILEMPVKEVLIAASLTGNSNYQDQVIRFNKVSDKYRIVFKSYVPSDEQWTDNTLTDKVEAIKKDMISDYPPDILILDSTLLKLVTLGDQGMLEDLNHFLSKDSELHEEDIIDSVLQAYTVNGQLLALPYKFNIQTLIGRSSIVGNAAGWTYNDLSALMDQYPDKQILNRSTKISFLSACLGYGMDFFIDEKTGTCHFNEKAFKDLLTLCSRFPLVYDPGDQIDESGDGFAEGKYLLEYATVNDVSAYLIEEIRVNEPVTFIGYPTPDGSPGSSIETGGIYTIPSASTHQEGAWEFIKFVLQTKDRNSNMSIPVLKSRLETEFTNAITPEYELDAEGNLILDDMGNKIERSKEGYAFDNSDTYYLYAVTEDKIGGIRSLIDSAVASVQGADDAHNIILEEAQAYFAGDKTVEEVADIIQSRVKIYVSENAR
jgi:ABC-type glycerol-3-phosphate transport system substrate-binding protein